MITNANYLDDSPSLDPLKSAAGMVNGEAAALIGPEGGTVRVTDPDSPIFGTTLRVPAGALETHALIRIDEGEHDCSFGLGPSVKISPEGLRFKYPAEVDMHMNYRTIGEDDDEPSFFVYDESSETWAPKDGCIVEPEKGVVRCQLWHL